jgi:hypothetical protein
MAEAKHDRIDIYAHFNLRYRFEGPLIHDVEDSSPKSSIKISDYEQKLPHLQSLGMNRPVCRV